MLRALIALICLTGCATAPEPLAVDPLAYQAPLDEIDARLLNPNTSAAPSIIINPRVTAICGDGWFSYSPHRRGTCSGHQGVREWRNPPRR